MCALSLNSRLPCTFMSSGGLRSESLAQRPSPRPQLRAARCAQPLNCATGRPCAITSSVSPRSGSFFQFADTDRRGDRIIAAHCGHNSALQCRIASPPAPCFCRDRRRHRLCPRRGRCPAAPKHDRTGSRGVFKITDGGRTWQHLTNGLPDDGQTGATDLVMDASNPEGLYAARYQRLRRPWRFDSGGPNGGIYKTTDGSAHWSNLGLAVTARRGRIRAPPRWPAPAGRSSRR